MAMPDLSASLDKASYVPGETAILTVSYNGDGEANVNTITVRGVDGAGNAALVTVQLTVVDKISLSVVDDSGRVWTLLSDDGSTAVFTATI
jgi:hypothetical protein